MSSITQALLRQSRAIRPVQLRPFTSSLASRKSATEVVKDAAKTVDRKVADKLVGGIEIGQTAAQKAKEVAGMSSSEAKGKAQELKGEAKGKASEAQGKAQELKGQAKGKAEEIKGKM